MLRITIIVMTMILTKLMANPSGLAQKTRDDTGRILKVVRPTVNEGMRSRTGKTGQVRINFAFVTEIRPFVPAGSSSYLNLRPNRPEHLEGQADLSLIAARRYKVGATEC
jgi:hypothetical protein